jgi:hypothetical protein
MLPTQAIRQGLQAKLQFDESQVSWSAGGFFLGDLPT